MRGLTQHDRESGFWIVAEPDVITEIADWLDETRDDPRYLVHPTGLAIAVAHSSDAEEVAFVLAFGGEGPRELTFVGPHGHSYELMTRPLRARANRARG